jgi:hypothetical protein
MRTSTVISAAMALMSLAACTGPAVVTTDDAGPPASASPTAAPPPLNSANLVNAFQFGAPVDGFTQYFFTTPSGRWECAVVPRVRAGCQAAEGAGLGIEGAPESVTDVAGEQAAPNAIVITRDGEPAFVALEDAPFRKDSGAAEVLRFNQILAVAGFRCNVQEASGVSCVSERSGRGFTFSAEGYAPQYTDVPAGAVVTPPTSTTR